jgi:hypothetical protein
MRKIVLPKLEEWQKPVYDIAMQSYKTRNRIVVKAKRQCGKSVIAALIVIAYSLAHEGTSVCLQPTNAHAERMHAQIEKMLEGSGTIRKNNHSSHIITLKNGSEILFKSAEQKDNLRGFTATNILVIDEAAYISDEIYEIVYPMTDANAAPILYISTPLFEDGEFYKVFTNPTSSPNFFAFDWTEYDTSKFLPPEQLEYYRKTMSEINFKKDYLGEFITEGSQLLKNISQIINDDIKDNDYRYVGIDWGSGKEGDYTAVVFMSEQGNVTHHICINDKTPTEQIDIISSEINKRNVKVVQVEENSIGTVYADLLKKKLSTGIKLKRFTTTNESKRKIIDQLIEAVNTEKIQIPNDKEMIKQLQHYSITKTKNGYTYNGIGAHDDYCIALALVYDLLKNKTNITIKMV